MSPMDARGEEIQEQLFDISRGPQHLLDLKAVKEPLLVFPPLHGASQGLPVRAF